MNKKAVGIFVGLMAMGALASAATVSCDPTELGQNVTSAQLAGSDGCSLGGLVFSNFSVTSAPSGSTVFLSALGTGVVGNIVNLGFQIIEPLAPVDTILIYKVTGATGGVDLGQNGNLTQIQEVVCDTGFVNGVCPTNHVVVNYSNPPTANGAEQLYINGPEHIGSLASVWILKDVRVLEGGSISSFTNSHLAVPEPMTLSLMGVGLLGLGLLRKKVGRS